MSKIPPPKRPPAPLPVATSEITRKVLEIPSAPKSGVPSVVIEDPTPVGIPLEIVLERRTKQTRDLAQAASTSIESLRTDVAQLHTKYSELDGKVDVLAGNMSNVDGKLDILVKVAESNMRVVEHHSKITIERDATESKIRLQDDADQNKFRRQRWLKILGIVGGIVTALTTAFLAGRC